MVFVVKLEGQCSACAGLLHRGQVATQNHLGRLVHLDCALCLACSQGRYATELNVRGSALVCWDCRSAEAREARRITIAGSEECRASQVSCCACEEAIQPGQKVQGLQGPRCVGQTFLLHVHAHARRPRA